MNNAHQDDKQLNDDTSLSQTTNNNQQTPFGDSTTWNQKPIELMYAGVTIIDPNTTIIESDVEIGQDTVIFPGCVLRGKTSIGSHCKIGPLVTIIDSKIGDNVKVKTSCSIQGVEIQADITIEPFQHLTSNKE